MHDFACFLHFVYIILYIMSSEHVLGKQFIFSCPVFFFFLLKTTLSYEQ